jgi:hypothetical protein
MLDFDEFQSYVCDNIKDFLPEEFESAKVDVNLVIKNNDKKLHGLVIRKEDSNISPTIYLEQFYEGYKEHGIDLEVVMEHIAQVELEHCNPSQDYSDVAEKFRDTDFIKSHVVLALVNAEKNAELLKEIPHVLKEDLAIIYKIYLGGNSEGTSTITVRNQHMKGWDITPEELHECALENSRRLLPVKVQDMESVLREMMGGDLAEDMLPKVSEEQRMYVVTNEQKVNGAAGIIYSDVLEQLSEKIGTDLYILPSSVHEIIAISSSYGTPDELARMVKEVNSTQVSAEDQLSDHVYKFSADTKTLSIADVSGEELDISKVCEEREDYAETEASRPPHHR